MIGFFVLDGARFKRRTRGFIGLGLVTAITIVVWSCALAWQVTFTRSSDITKINYKESRYDAKGTLYFFYYFGDAMYQALAYWIMGAISNDPFTLARFAGFYKAIQSAGGAGSYGMDAVATPFLNEHVRLLLLSRHISISLSLWLLLSVLVADVHYPFLARIMDYDADLVPIRRSRHLPREGHYLHRGADRLCERHQGRPS